MTSWKTSFTTTNDKARTIPHSLPEGGYTPPLDPYLTVLYEDDHLLVVDKPSGLLTVPGKAPHLADCLAARAAEHVSGARIVHRLDMDTSGLVILAKTARAQGHLGKQFERRHVKKTYVARVYGMPDRTSGAIDLPLRCDWENRPRQMVDHSQGKRALTRWRLMEREFGAARLALRPVTGRSHQLRVHLNAIGHPILGDPFYGHEASQNGAERLHLHAARLKLFHLETGAICHFTSRAPF